MYPVQLHQQEGIPDQPGENPQAEVPNILIILPDQGAAQRSCCSQLPSRLCKISCEGLMGTCRSIGYLFLKIFSYAGPNCCQEKAYALETRLPCDFQRIKVLWGKPIEQEEERLNLESSVCKNLYSQYQTSLNNYERRKAQDVNEVQVAEEFPIKNEKEAYLVHAEMLKILTKQLELSKASNRLLELRRDMNW